MQQGDRAIVAPWVKPDDYGKLFPTGVEVALVPSGKNYLRTTYRGVGSTFKLGGGGGPLTSRTLAWAFDHRCTGHIFFGGGGGGREPIAQL